MEIKKGQWVRTTGNIIYKSNNNLVDNNKNKFIKVADTPQELIEVGDLYRIKNSVGKSLLTEYCDDELGNIILNLQEVTICEILTPNSNGGYDLQWSVSKDK